MVKALRTSVRGGGLRQGGLQPGIGSDNIFATASLDLDFARHKNLGQQVDATTGSNLVDFTRASSGTYVGSDGLIKTATTNLLTYSEEFDNAVWQVTGPGEVTIVSGVEDPLGGNTADTLHHDSGAGDTGWLRRLFSGVNGQTYTLSFWLRRRSGTGNFFAVVGDNVNQVVSSVTSTWQRFSVSNTISSTTLRAYFKVDSAGDQFDIWGAQLEQSDTVGEYVKTTSTINSAPRFDHDPTTGESLGLLVEESRTNSVRNNTMVGAVAGTPGTNPNNWTYVTTQSNGLTRSIIGTGTENGINYIDYRFNGTTVASPNAIAFGIEGTAGVAATGQTWTGAVYLRLVNGTLTGVNSTQIGLIENTSGGVFVSGAFYNVSSPTSAALISQRATATRTLSGGATVGTCALTVNIPVAGSTDIDFTLRIGMPQLEQGAFATSVIPTTSSTVTRAADVAGIYDDNFGVFRTNLLQYSEDFADPYWISTTLNGTITTNQAAAPDGTITANLYTENTNFSVRTLAAIASFTSGTFYTISVWAKQASGTRYLGFVLQQGAFGSNCIASFTLSGSGSYNISISGTGTTANIQQFSNGWYRCSLTSQATVTASAGVQFRLSNSPINGATSYTGDGTSGIYVWGAQLEEGSTATNYIKSDVNFVSRASSATYYDANGVIQTAAVDEARTAAYLPDGNGNFVSTGPLLLEAAGTNLLLQSEDFSTTWITASATVTANSDVAPDGTTTADTITASSSIIGRVQQQITFTGDGEKAISVWLKAGTAPTSIIKIDDSTAGFALRLSLSITWTNGVASGSITQGTLQGIDAFPNGWYRIRASATGVVAANSNRYRIEPDSTNGTGSVIAWGAQAENGSLPTSYIPTTSSTATRAADVSTSAATTVFESDWYRQEEGTVFADIVVTLPNSGGNQFVLRASDNSYNNAIAWNIQGGGVAAIGTNTGGVFDGIASSSTALTANLPAKFAGGYQANNLALSLSGATSVIDTSATIPTVLTRADIGSDHAGVNRLKAGTIRRLTYWPTRLPNETLQTITQ